VGRVDVGRVLDAELMPYLTCNVSVIDMRRGSLAALVFAVLITVNGVDRVCQWFQPTATVGPSPGRSASNATTGTKAPFVAAAGTKGDFQSRIPRGVQGAHAMAKQRFGVTQPMEQPKTLKGQR
jgi:hypothetical protein